LHSLGGRLIGIEELLYVGLDSPIADPRAEAFGPVSDELRT
jgi:hypothetical protein